MRKRLKKRKRSLKKKPKTAFIFCGGGVTGFVYELGALLATEQLLGEDFTCNDFDIFIGISAGASLATLIALGVPPSEVYSSIVHEKSHFFNPEKDNIFEFSLKGPKHSAFQFGKLISLFYKKALKGKGFKFFKTPGLFSEMMPDGLFNMDAYIDYWNNFLKKQKFPKKVDGVKKELYIIATHLDTAKRTVFGRGYQEGVDLAQAIAASSAIPAFLEPVRIKGEDYIDGTSADVAPIDLAIKRGAKLIIIYNPMVPINNDTKKVCIPSFLGKCAHVREKGLIKIFDQALRAQIHDRLHVRLQKARLAHPDVDLLLVEPRTTETPLFLYSPMSYQVRKEFLKLGIESATKLAMANQKRLKSAFKKNSLPLNKDFFKRPYSKTEKDLGLGM